MPHSILHGVAQLVGSALGKIPHPITTYGLPVTRSHPVRLFYRETLALTEGQSVLYGFMPYQPNDMFIAKAVQADNAARSAGAVLTNLNHSQAEAVTVAQGASIAGSLRDSGDGNPLCQVACGTLKVKVSGDPLGARRVAHYGPDSGTSLPGRANVLTSFAPADYETTENNILGQISDRLTIYDYMPPTGVGDDTSTESISFDTLFSRAVPTTIVGANEYNVHIPAANTSRGWFAPQRSFNTVGAGPVAQTVYHYYDNATAAGPIRQGQGLVMVHALTGTTYIDVEAELVYHVQARAGTGIFNLSHSVKPDVAGTKVPLTSGAGPTRSSAQANAATRSARHDTADSKSKAIAAIAAGAPSTVEQPKTGLLPGETVHKEGVAAEVEQMAGTAYLGNVGMNVAKGAAKGQGKAALKNELGVVYDIGERAAGSAKSLFSKGLQFFETYGAEALPIAEDAALLL